MEIRKLNKIIKIKLKLEIQCHWLLVDMIRKIKKLKNKVSYEYKNYKNIVFTNILDMTSTKFY